MAINFFALGASRIRAVISAVAFQGIWLGMLILVIHSSIDLRSCVLVVITVLLKGIVIPALLTRAMRAADIQHEVTPVVGFVGSLLLGAAGTALALQFSSTLELAERCTFDLGLGRVHFPDFPVPAGRISPGTNRLQVQGTLIPVDEDCANNPDSLHLTIFRDTTIRYQLAERVPHSGQRACGRPHKL